MSKAEPKPDSQTEPNTGYGILSYIGILIIVPLLDDAFKKSEYGKHHLNQALVMFIAAFGSGILSQLFLLIPFVGWILYLPVMAIISIALFIFWIMGIVSAAKGQMTKLPFIGDFEILK